jgi:transcriptional regulator with XRE-family HTH domain
VGKGIYSTDQARLVARLRQARQTAALSQVQVAKLMGRSQSYISKMESGQRQIKLTQLRELARIYDTDIGFFISE